MVEAETDERKLLSRTETGQSWRSVKGSVLPSSTSAVRILVLLPTCLLQASPTPYMQPLAGVSGLSSAVGFYYMLISQPLSLSLLPHFSSSHSLSLLFPQPLFCHTHPPMADGREGKGASETLSGHVTSAYFPIIKERSWKHLLKGIKT